MQRKKMERRALLGLGGVAAGSLFAGRAIAGSLEPPAGSPTPTGRALKDIEPRAPINGLPSGQGALHLVSAGGSYKLTGNLSVAAGQVAIRISTTEPVSIDLNGFSIQGGGSGGGGIIADSTAPGCPYLEIFDGYIRDMNGVGIDGGTARVLECNDLHIDNVDQGIVARVSLTVEGCLIERCAAEGIVWNKTTSDSAVLVVNDCEIRACDGSGVSVEGDWTSGTATASITDTDALANLGDGVSIDLQVSGPAAGGHLSASIQDVRATLSGGRGVNVQAPPSAGGIGASLTLQCEDVVCTGNDSGGMRLSGLSIDLIDCVASQNSGDGFVLESTQGSIDNCMALKNTGDGVHLMGACRMSVSEVAAHSNGGSGIRLDVGVTGTPVQDNDVRDQPFGIRVQGDGNLLIRNVASNNGVNYQLETKTPAVILTPAQLASSHNPHANYSNP